MIGPGKPSLRQVYVERFADLIKIDGLARDSLIYEGSAENAAQRAGDTRRYRNLGESWYRAGVRAQQIFAGMAKRRGWILEEIAQDPESFQAYTAVIGKPVKRGDFLIRNLHHLEIEVKCRTFYESGAGRFFYFSAEDLEKHLNMQSSTHTPVVVVVYRRKEDRPVSDSLCMISMDRIRELVTGLSAERREYGAAYRIPLCGAMPGFTLLKEYEMTDENSAGRLEESEAGIYRREGGSVGREPYFLVGYRKSSEHLEWIVDRGLYNVRMGNDRGALRLGIEASEAADVLLHTKGEKITGSLFRILDAGPRIFSKETLVECGYPGRPAHDFYLVYRVDPVADKELVGRKWDICDFKSYRSGHGIAFPFL